jgi:predicted nucleotidyltransferase
MEEYLSVTQYALKNQKDVGNVRRLLLSGRLPGMKVGNQWIIKKDTPYPVDNRIKEGKYINQRGKNKFFRNKPVVNNLLYLIKGLETIYEDDAVAVVVYGSYARGTEGPDSDIDIAIFVKKTSKQKRDQMIDAVSKYELVTGKVISAIEIDYKQFNAWKDSMPFYKSIRKECIVLWKNANYKSISL